MSFFYAGRGVISCLKERNMRIHLVISIFVIILGFIVHLSRIEWMIILILISLVFSAELKNTSVEELANIVRDEMNLNYKATTRTRDLAAGSVFVIAICAAAIGIAIFIPKF